jgi:Transposase DDE domain
MRTRHYTITAAQVQTHAAQLLVRHLRLRDHGPKTTAANLLALLFYAAARLISVAAACASLLRAPTDQAVYNALRALLPDLEGLQRRLNRALAADLPPSLSRRPQPLAIDLFLVPYHGQPLHDAQEVYRSKPKGGTSHFHAYATAYVIRSGRRFTLALTYVRKGEALKAVVQRLLRQAARVGVRPRYLLVDRGFWGVDVIRYLQAARVSFLMPVVFRGRKVDDPRGPSATRVFQAWKRSGWSRYTLVNEQKRRATVSICVKCRNRRGERGRRGREALVYGYWGLRPASYQWVKETYRSRFAIETSYRQLHQARIRTCTRDPLLRLLYVGVALVLRQVWVWLHGEVLSHRRRGGRRIDLGPLSLRKLLVWLQHLVEARFGFRDEVLAEHPFPA